MSKHFILVVLLLSIMVSACSASMLHDYVNAPDSTYSWKVLDESSNRLGSRVDIELTSQNWHDITWKHRLVVFKPSNCAYTDTALLFITGNYRDTSMELNLGWLLATRSKCMVSVLFDIPNQPLFDGRREDALIAYTLLQYLQSKDPTWPLHFPMVKSAVRAMDTIEAYSADNWLGKISKFVLTGASKRGWTTWLTAAVDQKRVKGIMPMVYDNLNLKAQMERQVVSFGGYSEQIADYTSVGLQDVLAGKSNDPIAAAIDPWTYRDRLTMPKLIINGTNDPYWPQDALNIYWDGLKGPKWVLYMPNSGHGLLNNDEDGTKANMLAGSMASFIRSIAKDSLPPRVEWKHTNSKGRHYLTITANPDDYTAKMWVAHSATRDFRQSKWESFDMKETDSGFVGSIALPSNGFMAVFGQVSTKVDGDDFTQSTLIEILNKDGKVD